jgi:hypothetical protein
VFPGEAGVNKVYIVQTVVNAVYGNCSGNNAQGIELYGVLLYGYYSFSQIRQMGIRLWNLCSSQQPSNRKTKAQYQDFPDQQGVV